MKWVKHKSKRSKSPKPKTAEEAKLEEAKMEARDYRNRNHRPLHYVHKNGVSKDVALDSNDIVPRQPRRARSRTARSPKSSKSPNRSALKDTSEAGKARRQRRRCSSITFCEQLEVKDIIPAKDLVSNKRQLWWQNTEYKQIVELSCAIVDLAKVDKNTETRGLEDLLRDDHAETFKTRTDVITAQRILRQRSSQRRVQDDEALSGLYQTSTAKYLREAALRANQDEKEVQNYLADTRRKVRRTWSL